MLIQPIAVHLAVTQPMIGPAIMIEITATSASKRNCFHLKPRGWILRARR